MSSTYKINKEDLINIKNIKGKARGQTMKNAFQCFQLMVGEEGLARLKEKLKELDCWVPEYEDYKNIKSFEWYPLWYDIIPIIVAAEVFGWDEEKIKVFGRCNQKVSFFEKTLLKYFVSLEQVLKLVPERFQKHYNIGKLESVAFNKKEKYAIVRLRDFSIHPVVCLLFVGYFESATAFVAGSQNLWGEETKCTFRGDPYHEFIMRWK